MNIHQKIKLARMLSGYRQSDLAEILDIKQSVIARYEREEEGRKPRIDSIIKIARATGWPIEWFENDRLEELILCNLTLPNIDYSETALATIERGLRNLLPIFFTEPVFDGAEVLWVCFDKFNAKDSFYIIYNLKTCIVIYASNKLIEFVSWTINLKFGRGRTITVNRDDIFLMVKTSNYSDEFNKFLHETGVPKHFSINTIKTISDPHHTKNILTKILVEVSSSLDEKSDLPNKIQFALEKELIKVHSIKML